ncbi:Uncharacterised protein [Zhongshania aliphaticivorans]|uniref:Dienelactone hydrolase domain-containing protein n=1 Tax=Zhongshania aliphaticivorans TaxID=1470434 RepID=A0A5S9NKK0_9GAMM|nr:prolyl oligopeptidase family serine peptidase [Zhongshania aliphaticivorans]CAA0090419.1 Uncharacterised protein [Zhongshania aliphaticivorans]CAA0097874.1 Uncharacterised protein [Zhongshania aliphaticivorans]
MRKIIAIYLLCFVSMSSFAVTDTDNPQVVKFPSGKLTLGGELFLPEGKGPFPVVLYNHGSAPKMKNSIASAAIGPEFAKNGWGFFMPYRRGQGLSEDQGPYIIDEINSARWTGWGKAAKKLVELHQTDHLSDQMAALEWLKKQSFVDAGRIATAGNSFGGIQVVLGVEKATYCAGVNATGAAQSWEDSEGLQNVMKQAVANANSPIFFFQAENDYNLAPTKVLSAQMKKHGKIAEVKIYPPFGSSAKEGHSLPWAGVHIWFDDTLAFINKHCANPNA